jgi:8-oxo-dGTP pyrophosphatase MutT (NUDIX family)
VTSITLQPVAPASTIVLLRGADTPEVFLVRRHRKSGFLPNVHVFPGGRLDPDDLLVAQTPGRVIGDRTAALADRMHGVADADYACALLVAAVRETFEESGVLLTDPVGAAPPLTGDSLAAARMALNAGDATFSAILDTHRLAIRADALVYFDQWVTPELEGRRFDTRFFLAVVPPEQHATHDGHETTEGEWLDSSTALARHAAQTIGLAPPTMWVLESLARLEHRDAILQWGAGRNVPTILPRLQKDGGRLVVAMPGDPLHPTAGMEPVTRRVVWDDGRWHLVGFALDP